MIIVVYFPIVLTGIPGKSSIAFSPLTSFATELLYAT